MSEQSSQKIPILFPQGTDEEMLMKLQKETFSYFTDEQFCRNGLIADKNQKGCPSSIAVVGLGLSSYIVGVERGYISREQGVDSTLTILRFFYSCHQGQEEDATGYKGFYYHFLDMETGKRMWMSELSTMDTALLMAGILTSVQYFTLENEREKEIRQLGNDLYRRVDWKWALNGKTTFSHGWKPETGFLEQRWDSGYSEAHLLYILGLGSPTYPIGDTGYKEWLSTFDWKRIYDIDFLYAGPLFIHQLSQIWLDLQGISDDFNKQHNIDYFENSRRAIYIQQQYSIRNPLAFERYGEFAWGLSASDGPGPAVYTVNGIQREFYDYLARGVPYGPDDGTISPWAIVASLPFAPEIVLDTIRHAIERLNLIKQGNHGFHASFNSTYPEKGEHPYSWVSPWQFGLNQGPVVLMIENYCSGLVWNLLHNCTYIINGLKRAGFTGGWLEND